MVQIYEEYWKLTLAWTNFNDEYFLKCLKNTIQFIDDNMPKKYTSELYQKLQKELSPIIELDDASLRKGINQLVKLGFINYNLLSYHPLAKEYVKEGKTNEERNLILSKVMYSNSSFNRSVTVDSNKNEINFFIKTIEHCQRLEDKLLGAMMTINIDDYSLGYITKEELLKIYSFKEVQDFITRKYNQINYLGNILKKLNGVAYKDGFYMLEKDVDKVQLEVETRLIGRDPYLQRIYKQQLQKESLNIYGNVKCMVEGLTYPVLIASHIKPFRISNDNEAFDPNNGLLLSKTLDSLFDLNYISFADDGSIIFYQRIAEDVKNFWQSYKLDARFLSPERCAYLEEHRNLCLARNT